MDIQGENKEKKRQFSFISINNKKYALHMKGLENEP